MSKDRTDREWGQRIPSELCADSREDLGSLNAAVLSISKKGTKHSAS